MVDFDTEGDFLIYDTYAEWPDGFLDEDDEWVDSHSVNCIKCNALVDERDCIPGPNGEGDICPKCQGPVEKRFTVVLTFDREPSTDDSDLREAVRDGFQRMVNEGEVTDFDDDAILEDFRVER